MFHARAVRAFVDAFVVTHQQSKRARTAAEPPAPVVGAVAPAPVAGAVASAAAAKPVAVSKKRASNASDFAKGGKDANPPNHKRMKMQSAARKSAEADVPADRTNLEPRTPLAGTPEDSGPGLPANPIVRMAHQAALIAAGGKNPEWQCPSRIPEHHLNLQETLIGLKKEIDESPGTAPAQALSALSTAFSGTRCWVWWPDEDTCFRGVVQGLSLKGKQFAFTNAARARAGETDSEWITAVSCSHVSVLYDDPADRGPYQDTPQDVFVATDAIGDVLRNFKRNLQAKTRLQMDATALSALPEAGRDKNLRPSHALMTGADDEIAADAPAKVLAPNLVPAGGEIIQQMYRHMQATAAVAAVKAEMAESLQMEAQRVQAAAQAATQAAALAAANSAKAAQAYLAGGSEDDPELRITCRELGGVGVIQTARAGGLRRDGDGDEGVALGPR